MRLDNASPVTYVDGLTPDRWSSPLETEQRDGRGLRVCSPKILRSTPLMLYAGNRDEVGTCRGVAVRRGGWWFDRAELDDVRDQANFAFVRNDRW